MRARVRAGGVGVSVGVGVGVGAGVGQTNEAILSRLNNAIDLALADNHNLRSISLHEKSPRCSMAYPLHFIAPTPRTFASIYSTLIILISDTRTHHARTQAKTRRWFAKFIITLDLTSRLAFNTYVLQYVCLGLEMRGGLSGSIFSWYDSILV